MDDWVGEESSSIIPAKKLSSFEIGGIAPVKTAAGTYDGLVVAAGKYAKLKANCVCIYCTGRVKDRNGRTAGKEGRAEQG